MTTPTFAKLVKVYIDSASIERLKCGKPNEGTVRNTLSGVRTFRRWLNVRRENRGLLPFAFPVSEDYDGFGSDDSPLVSIITPRMIHVYLADMLKRKVKPVTAVSYVTQLQQLFAKWVRPYYEDHGWKIPAFPSFGKRIQTPRYNRPSRELLAKVKQWYESISDDRVYPARRSNVSGRQIWFVATMMLEFAMRNSDIGRLSRSNFISQEGRIFLNYIPHKTMNSSARMVKWPVHSLIWNRLMKGNVNGTAEDLDLPELDQEVFDALNRQMRSLGFTGSKGAYELRKICIDHIYQQFGAEKAVSVSGDNIRTIMYYYADPAQPNIGDLRVTDLL